MCIRDRAKVDAFQKVLENARRLKKNRDATKYPLEFDSYNEYIDNRDEEAEKFKGLFDNDVESLQISNLAVDAEYIASDESRTARNEDWMETVQKDFYLEETMLILKDMVNYNSTSLTKSK